MKYIKSTLFITALTLLSVGCANATPTQQTLTKSQLKALEKKHCNGAEHQNLLVYYKSLGTKPTTCKVTSTKDRWSRLTQKFDHTFIKRITSEINPAGDMVKYSPTRPIKIIYPNSPMIHTDIPIKFDVNNGLRRDETLKLYKLEKNKKPELVLRLHSNFNNPITNFSPRFNLSKDTEFILKKTKNNKLLSSQNFIISNILNLDILNKTEQKGNALKTYKIKVKKNKIKSRFDNDMKGKTAMKSITYKSSEGEITIASSILSPTPLIKFKFKNQIQDKNIKVHVKLINEKN